MQFGDIRFDSKSIRSDAFFQHYLPGEEFRKPNYKRLLPKHLVLHNPYDGTSNKLMKILEETPSFLGFVVRDYEIDPLSLAELKEVIEMLMKNVSKNLWAFKIVHTI